MARGSAHAAKRTSKLGPPVRADRVVLIVHLWRPASRPGAWGVPDEAGGSGLALLALPAGTVSAGRTTTVKFEKTFVPYGGYWSTPFVRWQGSLAQSHPVVLAAEVARRALGDRSIEAGVFDSLFFGLTVPSPHSFYAAPWAAALIGSPEISGPTIMQACATSARLIAQAAGEVDGDGGGRCILGLVADRTSNGPHLYYPDATGPGGRGTTEDWVWDNFLSDPYAEASPTTTAENVAREQGISRQEQDEVTLVRYEQYMADRKNGGGFQRRYLVAPLEVRDA